MNYCKDCKHYRRVLFNDPQCLNPAARQDGSFFVDGKRGQDCDVERSWGNCGRVGKLFEAKPAPMVHKHLAY